MQGFAQLMNPPTGEGLGRNRGDTLKFTYFPNITTSGGQLSENAPIPKGSIIPVSNSLTMYEWGNATDFTGKLADLADLDVENSMIQALVDDMHKTMNTAAYNETVLTKWIATFTATDEFRTDGVVASFAGGATQQLDLSNLNYVVAKARTNNIPYYDGESYVYVTGVDSMQALCYDTAVTTMLQHDSGRAALNGEVGRIGKCRLVEDNHKITKVGGASSGAGLQLDKGFLFGADALMCEYAVTPEIRAQDGDFGRSCEVAWYSIFGVKKIYNQDSHSREHIIAVTSK
jgi:hypothetical protein